MQAGQKGKASKESACSRTNERFSAHKIFMCECDGCSFRGATNYWLRIGHARAQGKITALSLCAYLLATVDVITEEEVVGVWREAAILKETQQVVVLAVDIPTNLQRCFEFKKDRLVQENLSRFCADSSDFLLRQSNNLPRPAASDYAQGGKQGTKTARTSIAIFATGLARTRKGVSNREDPARLTYTSHVTRQMKHTATN